MTNSADPDQLASSVCKSRVYPGSAEQGLKKNVTRQIPKTKC